MRWGGAVAAVVCVLPGAAMAQTPAVLDPAQIPALEQKFIQHHLAKAARSDVDTSTGFESLLLVQMIDPDNPQVLSRLGTYPGKPDSYYLNILTFLPDDPAASFYLANNLFEDEFPDLAKPFFERFLRHGDAVGFAYEKAALNAFFAEDYQACVTLYTQALAKGEDNYDIYQKRAQCHAFLGNKAEARKDFAAAVAEKPGLKWAYGYRMFDDGVFNGCRGSAASRTASGRKHFNNGDMYKAYRDATAALICDPKDIPAQQLRLDIEERDTSLLTHRLVHKTRLQNQMDGGQTYAARMQKLTPPSAEEMLKEGEYLDISSDRRAMIRAGYLAHRVLMVQPDNPRARLLRARAYNNLRIDLLGVQAWADLDVAVKDPATRTKARHVRAILLNRVEQPKRAIDEINLALADDPGNKRFITVRAWSYAMMGDDAAAVRDLDTVLAAGPDEAALDQRWRARERLGDKTGAIEDIQAYLLIKPGDMGMRIHEIRLLDETGQRSRADARHLDLLQEKPQAARADAYLAQRNPDIETQLQRVHQQQAVEAQQRRIDGKISWMTSRLQEAQDYIRQATSTRDPEDFMDLSRQAEQSLSWTINEAEIFLYGVDGQAMNAQQRSSFDQLMGMLKEAKSLVSATRDRLSREMYGDEIVDYYRNNTY